MQVGVITVDGHTVGVVTYSVDEPDTFTPDLDGYVPEGRAADRNLGGEGAYGHGGGHHFGRHGPHHEAPLDDRAPHKIKQRSFAGGENIEPPTGKQPQFQGGEGDEIASPSHEAVTATPTGRRVRRGSAETEAAIEAAAKRHGLDPSFMKGVASIESDMNPSSNADNERQYKGLYQMGSDEWRRFGHGNIYSARDNAEAAAAKFEADAADFRTRFGRDPTDAERYMIHQQGMGHFTRGALTNVEGNRYPGMHGPQTPESFREGWGRELERRKAQFAHPEAEAVQSPSGSPAAFIMHHTGGRGTVEGVEDTLRARGLGVQYIMDREGNIVEAGGHSHMLPGWGKGEGLSNANTVGMEVIAKDNADVTPAQVEAAKAFIAKNYPDTPVFGHGEVNPGHKEADEGMKIVNAIRDARSNKAAEPAERIANGTAAP